MARGKRRDCEKEMNREKKGSVQGDCPTKKANTKEKRKRFCSHEKTGCLLEKAKGTLLGKRKGKALRKQQKKERRKRGKKKTPHWAGASFK